MRISIIVPCYNVNADFFRECLLSIREQSYKYYEVIIIDDGSDEWHSNMTKRMSKNIIPRSIYYYQENQGVSVARNNAMKYAKGDYICFIDADDLILPNFLEEASKIAKITNADFIIGGNKVYNNDIIFKEKSIRYCCLSPSYKEGLKANMIGTIKFFGNQSGYIGRGPVTRLIRRSIAEKTPFNQNLKIGEDIVWNLDLFEKTEKIVIVERIWYLYRLNSDSANHKPNKDAIRICEDELNAIADHVDLNNNRIYASYCERIIQDLQRIYDTYLANKSINHDLKFGKETIRRIINRKPWNEIKELRALRVMSFKNKIKTVLLIIGGYTFFDAKRKLYTCKKTILDFFR